MHKRHSRISLSLLLTCLLAACSATGEKFSQIKSPDASAGALYVYRLPNLAAGGHAPLLIIDGSEVASLKNAGYVRKELPAGRHVIELRNGSILSSMKPMSVDLTVDAGATYFLRYTVDHLGSQHVFGTTAFIHDFYRAFDPMGRDVAVEELKQTHEIK